MSLELTAQIKSLKVTDETLQWLQWKALSSGKSHAEIARDALHMLAINEMDRVVHEFNLLSSLKPRKNLIGEVAGKHRALSTVSSVEK